VAYVGRVAVAVDVHCPLKSADVSMTRPHVFGLQVLKLAVDVEPIRSLHDCCSTLKIVLPQVNKRKLSLRPLPVPPKLPCFLEFFVQQTPDFTAKEEV